MHALHPSPLPRSGHIAGDVLAADAAADCGAALIEAADDLDRQARDQLGGLRHVLPVHAEVLRLLADELYGPAVPLAASA
jgi:hypothetical protein